MLTRPRTLRFVAVFIWFVHQKGFWCTDCRGPAAATFRNSSSLTSGTQSHFHAHFVPHLETADLPHSPLQATFPFFRCVISGANTALHTVFPPEVSHQEQTHHCTQLFLLICYIGKPATCSRAHSRPHSHFSDVLHQERKRLSTQFFLLICYIGNDDEDDGE